MVLYEARKIECDTQCEIHDNVGGRSAEGIPLFVDCRRVESNRSLPFPWITHVRARMRSRLGECEITWFCVALDSIARFASGIYVNAATAAG